jgi:phage terminase small subunit
MPIYNPKIHDPLIIDLQEIDFVQALMDIDSPTFSNYYQSAIKAGYRPSYARVIGQHFPKCRIKQTIKTMRNPLAQATINRMREEPDDLDYQPSKREQKRLRTEQNRQFKEVKLELEAYLHKRSI